MLNLKFGKVAEVLLAQGFLPELCHHPLVDASSCVLIAVSNLEFGHLQVCTQQRISLEIPIQNLLGILWLVHTLLKADERHPGLFSWQPGHPPLEDVASFLILSNNFLHVGILEPELVLSWQVVSGPFPYVPSVVDELMLHLHLGIAQPETLVRVVNFQSSLEYRSSSRELFGSLLPLSIPNPGTQIVALPTYLILELPSLLLLADIEFLLIHDQLGRRLDSIDPMNLRV